MRARLVSSLPSVVLCVRGSEVCEVSCRPDPPPPVTLTGTGHWTILLLHLTTLSHHLILTIILTIIQTITPLLATLASVVNSLILCIHNSSQYSKFIDGKQIIFLHILIFYILPLLFYIFLYIENGRADCWLCLHITNYQECEESWSCAGVVEPQVWPDRTC